MSLNRSTPLRRTPMKRGTPLKATTSRPKRARDTGPTSTTRTEVWGRAGGRCEVCGSAIAGLLGFSVHHRHPRRMGGSRRPELNTPANLILVCGSGTTGCHGRIESNREQAYAEGLLLHDGADPAAVPVLLHTIPGRFPELVYLTVDGTYALDGPNHDQEPTA